MKKKSIKAEVAEWNQRLKPLELSLIPFSIEGYWRVEGLSTRIVISSEDLCDLGWREEIEGEIIDAIADEKEQSHEA